MSNSDFIKTIKANSSRWIHETFQHSFAWQIGYGAFSVSQSNIPSVQRYIENQEEHHKKIDYEEEFRKFLKVHGFDIQETDN